jgi:hypothetical protein
MRVPKSLAEAFGPEFEKQLAQFAVDQELLPDLASLKNRRFLTRSILPHMERLTEVFNRLDPETGRSRAAEGVGPYWKSGSNPANLRLAYFLGFMPGNLFRVASIWAELQRLGFRWKATEKRRNTGAFQAIELGAGPATGACGIAAGEKHASIGLPEQVHWTLLEQDQAVLRLGGAWARNYFDSQAHSSWEIEEQHRKLDFTDTLLPKKGPTYDLWLMSYVLNESPLSPEIWADRLIDAWGRHLEDGGLAILCEPALKLQSRRLLELRKILIERSRQPKGPRWLKVLTPCLGHQACGALAAPDDWCHEEVLWWRPDYLREIDKLAGLDRKSLPFSHLVITRSEKPIEELLPTVAAGKPENRYRLVSPAHSEGRDLEFFLCGTDGKRRARYRPDETQVSKSSDPEAPIQRGTILLEAELRGDPRASRIDRVGQLR